jgi:general secretion pathway protein M
MSFFQDLGTREKVFVVGAVGIVLLLLFYLLVFEPLMAHSARLDRQLIATQQQLQEMYTLQQEYRRHKTVLDRINAQLARQRNFSLFSRLEELARKTNTRSSIDYMRPIVSAPSEAYDEDSVEIKMDGVTLAQLVSYLYEIETSPQFMKIKRLYLKPRLDNRQQLTAIFRVSTFTPKANAS